MQTGELVEKTIQVWMRVSLCLWHM